MRVGAGTVWRGLVPVVVLGGVLTGCSQTQQEGATAGTSASATAAAGAAGQAARSGGTIGSSDSACELPVTFDVAEDWKAKAVDSGTAEGTAADDGSGMPEEVADALLTAACEIDAKPAGHIGFLRVWTGDRSGDDSRTVLKAFVAAEGSTRQEKYRTFRTGSLTGVEVEYLCTSKILDESKKERALAVTTPQGPVVLHLGGLDTEEHDQMLPAYELAKKTLRTA
ncbi:lipoprotein [Streptomyces sp. NPDC005202]|uniref:lipoprotein n=1 Tax=Streptomyces sp. NPDC005202 TaxID=3157021 RepID=UPI0033ADC6E9